MRDDNYPLESVAYGYLMSGDMDQAMAKYEELISHKDFGWEAQEYWIRAHYQLGKIHEEKGNNEKAIQYYQRFLDIWKDADAGLPEVTEAKKRLTKLKIQ